MSEKCCSGYPNCFHEVGSEHLSREARGHEISHDIADQQISALRRRLSEIAQIGLNMANDLSEAVDGKVTSTFKEDYEKLKRFSSPAESREEGVKAIRDSMVMGQGFIKDGKHIPSEEVFKSIEEIELELLRELEQSIQDEIKYGFVNYSDFTECKTPGILKKLDSLRKDGGK